MPRVLFLIDRYFPTDHAFIEEVYSKILPRRGFSITIAARSRNCVRTEKVRWNLADVILLPSKKKYTSDVLTLNQVRTLMQGDYDIIQVRNDPIFALLAPSEKFVFQLSHLKAEQFLLESNRRLSQVLKGKIDLFLRKRYLSKAKCVFAVSDAMQKDLIQRYAIKNSAVVPLGVSPVDINPTIVDSIKSKYQLSGRTAFVYSGTMNAARRLSIVLKAFATAYRKTEGALSLLFLGDAPDPRDVIHLKKVADHTSIQSIYFIDKVPRIDVPNYLAACDVGLATIPINDVYYCSSPTKTMEYLNCGLPVLATDIPEQARIISASDSGFLCRYTVEDIAHKMIDFHYCTTRRSMGARGQHHVRQTRTYELISDIVASCYQRILSSCRD